MTSVLLTGMSGTGKSTLLEELARRGCDTIDTDYDGWCVRGAGGDRVWDEPRMTASLDAARSRVLVVSGCVPNQGAFRDRFDLVVLLSAPEDVILDRVRSRANPYGSTAEDRRKIAADLHAIEPLLRASCDLELDATRPIPILADAVTAAIAEKPRDCTGADR